VRKREGNPNDVTLDVKNCIDELCPFSANGELLIEPDPPNPTITGIENGTEMDEILPDFKPPPPPPPPQKPPPPPPATNK